VLTPGKKLGVKKRFEVSDVTKVTVSTLADDFIFMQMSNTFEFVFENVRKTEICVCLKEHLAKMNKPFQIVFSDNVTYSIKSAKNRVITFELGDGAPEGGLLTAKGERGVVKVPRGLDANTNPSNTYVKKGQRGGGGGGGGMSNSTSRNNMQSEPAPSWGGSQLSSAKSAPPPTPNSPRVKSTIQLQSALAMFDYKSQANDELDLKEGDVVEIVSKDASGWWTGRLRGKQGLFPGNYVKEQASGPTKIDRANYPYGM